MNAILVALAVLGQTEMPIPDDNPWTAAKAALGQALFFDPRLSANNTVACATCHKPDSGFTDGLRVSTGILGRQGIRNAPTVVNAAFGRLMFRDGRTELVENQALQPLVNSVEMGNTSLANVVRKLNATGYRQRFQSVFGTDVTSQGIGQAIASFERTLTSYDAPIDRYLAGETWALNEQQERGLAVFERSGCTGCHAEPDFRGLDQFANTGTAVNDPRNNAVQRAAARGRGAITGQAADDGKFAIVSLRDVSRTSPYFHNGTASGLGDVVDHYNRGGVTNANLDPRIRPLGLSADERNDLIEFLGTAFESGAFPDIVAPRLPP